MRTPIGVFDSGYGGLTILREIRRALPQYDYCYLGDNARSPYGSRSFEVIRDFTLQAVEYLFAEGCPLVILACNTASAKALREIQQRYLPQMSDPTRRVLGVIRPTAEAVGGITRSGSVGLLATQGTVSSDAYTMELQKLYPEVALHQQACPMFVPLVEYGESESEGADYFVAQYLDALLSQDDAIDTIMLACTHYPLLQPKIERYLASTYQDRSFALLSQGELVAGSLSDYLHRHPEMAARLSRGGGVRYQTTECPDKFGALASIFVSECVDAERVRIG